MTDDAGTKAVGTAVGGWSEMAARQVTIHEWRVLSWRNDTVTAYKVNLRGLSCNCPDHSYNTDEHGVCAHIAKALFVAEARMDVAEAINFDLIQQVRRIQQAAESIESRSATVDDADGGSDTSDDGPAEEPSEAVRTVAKYLTEQDVPVEKIRIWEDDEYGSVQLDPKEYLDDGWGAWQAATEADAIWYDQSNDRYYVKPDNVEELVES